MKILIIILTLLIAFGSLYYLFVYSCEIEEEGNYFDFLELKCINNEEDTKKNNTPRKSYPTLLTIQSPKPNITQPPKPNITQPPKPNITQPPAPKITQPPAPKITFDLNNVSEDHCIESGGNLPAYCPDYDLVYCGNKCFDRMSCPSNTGLEYNACINKEIKFATGFYRGRVPRIFKDQSKIPESPLLPLITKLNRFLITLYKIPNNNLKIHVFVENFYPFYDSNPIILNINFKDSCNGKTIFYTGDFNVDEHGKYDNFFTIPSPNVPTSDILSYVFQPCYKYGLLPDPYEHPFYDRCEKIIPYK